MKKYEYKSITIDQHGFGILSSRKVPDLDRTLNSEGRDGWRLCQIIMPSAAFGESDKVILIFERDLVN